MVFAILQIADLNGDLFGGRLGLPLDCIEFLSQSLIAQDPFFEFLSCPGILMEKIHHRGPNLCNNPSPDLCIAQFIFCLALEHR